jgi:hypothetical protein
VVGLRFGCGLHIHLHAVRLALGRRRVRDAGHGWA